MRVTRALARAGLLVACVRVPPTAKGNKSEAVSMYYHCEQVSLVRSLHVLLLLLHGAWHAHRASRRIGCARGGASSVYVFHGTERSTASAPAEHRDCKGPRVLQHCCFRPAHAPHGYRRELGTALVPMNRRRSWRARGNVSPAAKRTFRANRSIRSVLPRVMMPEAVRSARPAISWTRQ